LLLLWFWDLCGCCGVSHIVSVGCSFTFDELEGFLEEAIQCVPGTKEAIDAAVDRKLNPVSRHP
jgi:hypothetical protein